MSRVGQRYDGAWPAVVDLLVRSGVDTCFGLPGDDLELLRALDAAGVDLVPCRDQRNAVYMAAGYALQSGRPGVCALGKGPAVTHAATGILEARESGAPVLLLGAGTPERTRGSGAFQELDQVAAVGPLVRWAYRVAHPDRVVPAAAKALALTSGPPAGPVYLEIADDVRTAEIVRTGPWPTAAQPLPDLSAPLTSGPAVESILASRRPVVLVGGGMRHHNPDGAVERFAGRLDAALFTTASGRGAVDERHPLFCGVAGLYAAAPARELFSSCDLVISLAGRLEETVTEGGTPWPAVPVVQVNISPGDLSAEHPGPRVVGDARRALLAWSRALDEAHRGARGAPTEAWGREIAVARKAMIADADAERADAADLPGVRIAEVLAALDATASGPRVLVAENGLQDMWCYCYPFHTGGGSVVPSEQTPLGFGAAAAIGVKRAAPHHEVTAFIGDGAFLAARADIEATARSHGGVLYVVLCNGGYGWLDAQRARLGLDAERHRFTSPGAPPPTIAESDLYHRVLRDKDTLTDELRAARRVCAQGRTAVLMVPVSPDDIAPPIRDAEVVPQ
ncbi:thiamine pyrophosphate-binding protein [Streptomyces sp. NPDC049916]|uniref:thiamine pyrophosphate-binding protein n=1 Tax=Streptomyces sp. NPDC049916 TaxID=3155156 RepID=UPI00343F30F4